MLAPETLQSQTRGGVLRLPPNGEFGDSARLDGGRVPLRGSALPGAAAAIGDWDNLLDAVKAKLRLTVGAWNAKQPQVPDTAARVQAGVLECVAALEQLHAMLAHEFGRRRQLERDLLEVQSTLAQTQTELSGAPAAERQAHHLGLRDALTLLPNRTLFQQRLHAALADAEPRHRPLAVLHIDLDEFKPINDTHGAEAGDELLRIVAARLLRAVRAEDMVSRLGDDEFALLLPDLADREKLSHLACKLFDTVSAPLKIGKLRLTVRPSIGIAAYPDDGETPQALLRHADAAMCHAKRHQTAYAFFDERSESWAPRRM